MSELQPQQPYQPYNLPSEDPMGDVPFSTEPYLASDSHAVLPPPISVAHPELLDYYSPATLDPQKTNPFLSHDYSEHEPSYYMHPGTPYSSPGLSELTFAKHESNFKPLFKEKLTLADIAHSLATLVKEKKAAKKAAESASPQSLQADIADNFIVAEEAGKPEVPTLDTYESWYQKMIKAEQVGPHSWAENSKSNNTFFNNATASYDPFQDPNHPTAIEFSELDPFAPSPNQAVYKPPKPEPLQPTPDQHIILTTEELQDPGKVVETMEQQHYVRVANRFREQVKDESRTNLFTYGKWGEAMPDVEADTIPTTLTEHEGLVGLDEFLKVHSESPDSTGYASRLKRMRESLTFIGEKEYAEAAKGLGEYWKAYLDANEKNDLFISADISEYNAKRKSDVYLMERILDTFSDDELAKYKGRIQKFDTKIDSDPDHTRIVLLDDWSISGSQMRTAYADVLASEPMQKYAKCVEANFIAAREDLIENGINLGFSWSMVKRPIPVKSYFKAHDASGHLNEYRAHITGTHSSVDYDFEVPLVHFVKKHPDNSNLNDVAFGMPPLTRIVRTYSAGAPLVRIKPDGSIVRTPEDER